MSVVISLITIIASVFFFAGVISCVILNLNMVYAVAFGAVCFVTAALVQRFLLRDILKMMFKGIKSSFGVVLNIFFIGILTGLWRSSGTIAFFVYYGIKIIPPKFFLLFAYLIPALLSYLIGTCYGTTGTVGVVLLVLGTSGGIDPIYICAAVVCGAFFGDRAAITSGNTNLVAACTGTEVRGNLKPLLINAIAPTLLTCVFFTVLSFSNPSSATSSGIAEDIKLTFSLTPWTLVPAVLILLLPILKVSVKIAMSLSFLSAGVISFFVQKMSFIEILKTAVFGFVPRGTDSFSQLIGGGGFMSMLNVFFLILISSTYSGIFAGTGMLKAEERVLERITEKIGVFPTTLLTALFTNCVGCSQTLAVILHTQLVRSVYEKRNIPKKEFAVNVSDTSSVIAGLIPWNISCTVPLGMLGAGMNVIPFLFFLYITPLCSLVRYYVIGIMEKRQKKTAGSQPAVGKRF